MRSRWVLPVFAVAIACLIGALGCAGAAAQQAAFKKVREKGGKIDLKGSGPQITFSFVKIVDEDLACLEGLSHIDELKLEGVDITDEGLVHLQSVEKIGRIHLLKTKVTQEGVEKLKVKFPDCEIIRR